MIFGTGAASGFILDIVWIQAYSIMLMLYGMPEAL
jgi:hypothetical protein